MSSHTERERRKKKPKLETRGVEDFVLAHVLKPSFGVIIYCGMLAFSTEVKNRRMWPPNSTEKSAARGSVNTRDAH